MEKAAELAANMKDTPEVEAIFATLDKDPEAQKALKSILAQLPDENIEEAEDLDPAGGIATTATFLMVGNTMYHVAAGKALMGAVVAAGLPIAGGLTGLALVALAMKYVKNRQRQAKKNSNEEKFKHHVGSKYYQGPAVKERKITKSKLAQIVQEELSAVKAEGYKAYKRDELGDENERIYPKRTLSRHAQELTKNIEKGYSPQAAVTAIPDNEEVDKAYYDSLNKKPKRGKKDLEEDLSPYTNLKGYVLQALRDLGGEDVLGDIAHVAGRAWAEDNWSREDDEGDEGDYERLSEEDMFYSVKAALESLEVDGRVRLTQGGPDSTDEDFYALVHKEDLDEARG